MYNIQCILYLYVQYQQYYFIQNKTTLKNSISCLIHARLCRSKRKQFLSIYNTFNGSSLLLGGSTFCDHQGQINIISKATNKKKESEKITIKRKFQINNSFLLNSSFPMCTILYS